MKIIYKINKTSGQLRLPDSEIKETQFITNANFREKGTFFTRKNCSFLVWEIFLDMKLLIS